MGGCPLSDTHQKLHGESYLDLLSTNPPIGALDWGSPMSPVDLKNDHVPCHYFCNVHVDF